MVSLVNNSPLHAPKFLYVTSLARPKSEPSNTIISHAHPGERERAHCGVEPETTLTQRGTDESSERIKKNTPTPPVQRNNQCAWEDHNFPRIRTQFAVQRLYESLLVHHTQTDVAGLSCTPRFLVLLYRSEIGWTCRTQPYVTRFIPINPQGTHKSAESCSLPQGWPKVDRGRSLVSIKIDLPPHYDQQLFVWQHFFNRPTYAKKPSPR